MAHFQDSSADHIITIFGTLLLILTMCSNLADVSSVNLFYSVKYGINIMGILSIVWFHIRISIFVSV